MQCDYSCTRASILKQHLLTHSGEKQFQCTQCISSCARMDVLKEHLPTHSGEKHFSCDQCDYLCYFSCSDLSGLKYPRLSLTGKKPIACRNSSNLNYHMFFSHKKCEYLCRQALELRNHMKKHNISQMISFSDIDLYLL